MAPMPAPMPTSVASAAAAAPAGQKKNRRLRARPQPSAAPQRQVTRSKAPNMVLSVERVQPTGSKSVPESATQQPLALVSEDFTIVPKLLDAKFSQLDTDNSLRSTILTTGPDWSRMRQENLLTKLKASILGKDEVESEKNKAFDLLDAI